jgi:GNAT superfamily N-acetyltransferase
MPLVITTDSAAVVRLAQEQAVADPVANTVFGSIAYGAQQADAAPWAAHPTGAREVLAARSQWHTPVGFTQGWTDVAAVTAAIGELDPPALGLGGPPDTVVAACELLGRPVTHRMDERLFRLDGLVPPRPTDGHARLADEDDAGWLAQWYTDFSLEAFGAVPTGFDAKRLAQRGVRRSRVWIWHDADGVPCAMAVAHPPVAGVSRIGPVFTRAERRGRGYGSAVTAAASRDVLDAGNVACLYTDLANPTSNKIYQELGYRPVLDRTTVRFD